MAALTSLNSIWLRDLGSRLRWNIARTQGWAARRLGPAGVLSLLAVGVLALTLWGWAAQRERWTRVQSALATLPQAAPSGAPASERPDMRARLRAFDDQLPPHDDIPDVLQDLMQRASAHGLVLARGSYRPLHDAQGDYLRYRMTLPVTGDAGVIQHFMMSALLAHRTLLLESVHFKRDDAESPVVQARIGWALLTRKPAEGFAAAPAAAEGSP